MGGGLLLGLGAAGVMVGRAKLPLWRWLWISAVFLVGFVAQGACFRPILSPSPLPKLTRELLAMKPELSTVYTHEAQPRVAGIIRILSGGKLKVQTITSIPIEGVTHFPSPIVTPKPEPLRKVNYTLVKVEPDTPLAHTKVFGQTVRSQAFWIGIRGSGSEDN
jgi:hypothetical protein